MGTPRSGGIADAPSAAALRDHDIVERLRTGELDQAFEMLARRYESKVYRLCNALLRDRQVAQDVTQDTFLRIWRALSRFDGRASLSTWIYAIARNRCLSALRKRAMETKSVVEEGDDRIEQLSETALDTDSAAAVRRLVDELPESLRSVILLYYFEDRSVAEVAHMLGQPEGTIKTHLFRARARLHARLEALGFDSRDAWYE